MVGFRLGNLFGAVYRRSPWFDIERDREAVGGSSPPYVSSGGSSSKVGDMRFLGKHVPDDDR